MRRVLFICLTAVLLFIKVNASEIENDIYAELQLEKAEELVPNRLDDTEIDFSPANTPAENGLNINTAFKTLIIYIFDSIGSELTYIMIILALLVLSSVVFSFIDPSHSALIVAARFTVSAIISTVYLDHIDDAFIRATDYLEELSLYMVGILPFIGSVSIIGGEVTATVVRNAIIAGAIELLQEVLVNFALPVCRIVATLTVVGYVSGVPLGTFSEFISSVATKIITVCCGIMCGILYFQDTVSSVTDSLALRSVKLASGSFIPIVGSFVSEASGTLISGVGLVKATFGTFAICVLAYMSARPLINFWVVKISARFSAVVAKLIGSEREAKLFSEVSSVYNILSAIMVASTCFFIFFLAIFIKSEIG